LGKGLALRVGAAEYHSAIPYCYFPFIGEGNDLEQSLLR